MNHAWCRSLVRIVSGTLCALLLFPIAHAQVMSSTNFKIQEDSINTGGGLSSSDNFLLEDTLGEIATGNSSSTNFNLKAGYQQMNEVYLSLSAIDDVNMTPALPGLTGGLATGSAAFLVTTDSASGYSVTISASTSPAMQSGVNTIADYIPAGAVPDFLFVTDPTDVHFGYSPEGPDIALRFQDSGGICGVSGGDTADRCYDGLSTTPVEIARSLNSNHPSGATTTVRFNVGLGGSVAVPAGNYEAITIITALPL